MQQRAWLRPAVLGVGALSVASGFAQFGVTTVLGDVAEAFGAVDEATGGVAAQVGMGTTELGIGVAVVRLASLGSLPGAALADRLGRRRVLLAVTGAGLVLTALAATSAGFWWFVALAAIARPLLSTTNALSGVVAAEETPSRDRAKALALISATYGIGSGLISLLRGTGGGLGFRTVLALALLPAAVLPALARVIREPPIARDVAPLHRPAVPGAVHPGLRPRLALVCSLAFAIAVVTGPAFTYLFVFGENVLGASPGTMAALVVAAGPVGLGGLLLGRWAADRAGRRVTAAVTMALTAGAAALAYSGSLPRLATGYLLTILASAAFAPAGGSLLAEVFPTSVRATASGWSTAAGVLGAVTGIAGFGVLAERLDGFAPAALLLALPVAASSVGYAWLPETRGLELEESAPEPPA